MYICKIFCNILVGIVSTIPKRKSPEFFLGIDISINLQGSHTKLQDAYP